MFDNEEMIRESEQLRILKNFIKLNKKTGKVILINDLENLVEAMDQGNIERCLEAIKELEEIENA